MSFARMSLSLAVGLMLIAPSAPPAHADGSPALRCAFAKQRALVRNIAAVLDCERDALRAGTTVDPACTADAAARLASDFAKAEARGGCLPEGDLAPLERLADQCSQRIFVPLQGACTAAGDDCSGDAPPCCTGLVCIGDVRSGTAACGF